jgi:hypothetical protein
MPSTPQSKGHPSRSAIEVLKNYIGVISQVNRPFSRIDGVVLKALICYVEVTSFEFIRFSVFCPEWGREAYRETTDILVGRGKCPPRGSR